jgi:ATP-dependent Clp protease ATP-binding subunit ClpA
MRAIVEQRSDSVTRNYLQNVLKNELDLLQLRVLENGKGQFFLEVTSSAREFLLLKAGEQRFGEYNLKLAIERNVVYPLALLFATDQIHLGDLVRVDRDDNQIHLNFTRERKDAVTPLPTREPEAKSLEALAA